MTESFVDWINFCSPKPVIRVTRKLWIWPVQSFQSIILQKSINYIKPPGHRTKIEYPRRLLNVFWTSYIHLVHALYPGKTLQLSNEDINIALLLLILFLFKIRNTHKIFQVTVCKKATVSVYPWSCIKKSRIILSKLHEGGASTGC